MKASRTSLRLPVATMASAIAALRLQARSASAQFPDIGAGVGAVPQTAQQAIHDAQCAAAPLTAGCPGAIAHPLTPIDTTCHACLAALNPGTQPTGGATTGGATTGGATTGGATTGGAATGGT